MEPTFLFLMAISAILNLALLIWFIVTLRSINRNTKTTANYIRCLALCHPPSEEQARVINRDLSAEEILARLAARGTTVRLREISDAIAGVPPSLGLDVNNVGKADPEMLHFVDEYRADLIEFLLRRQRTDDV